MPKATQSQWLEPVHSDLQPGASFMMLGQLDPQEYVCKSRPSGTLYLVPHRRDVGDQSLQGVSANFTDLSHAPIQCWCWREFPEAWGQGADCGTFHLSVRCLGDAREPGLRISAKGSGPRLFPGRSRGRQRSQLGGPCPGSTFRQRQSETRTRPPDP